MIGKDYLAKQATTLLRMARTVKDPKLQAKIAVKAADLQERLDTTEDAEKQPENPTH